MYQMLCLFCFIVSITEEQWISPETQTLPKSDSYFAIGHYDDIITILGGKVSPRDRIEYNITSNSFNYYNNTLPVNVNSVSQYWTQMDTAIYMVKSAHIDKYDLSTTQFNVNWNGITVPNSAGIYACIASSNQILYIMGGYPRTNLFQIYNISSNSWSQGPNMIFARSDTSCIVTSTTNTLYVIGGGITDATDTNTVEYITIDDIEASSWQFTHNNLSVALGGGIVADYDIYLYLIGGYGTSADNGFHTINTLTNTISSDALPYLVRYPAVIVVEHRLYSFGGGGSSSGNRWMYIDLATEPTTQEPTIKTTTIVRTTDATITTVPTTKEVDSTSTQSDSVSRLTALETSTFRTATDIATDRSFDVMTVLVPVLCIVVISICIVVVIYYINHFWFKRLKIQKRLHEANDNQVHEDERQKPPVIRMNSVSVSGIEHKHKNIEDDEFIVDDDHDKDNEVIVEGNDKVRLADHSLPTEGYIGDDEFIVDGDDVTNGYYMENKGEESMDNVVEGEMNELKGMILNDAVMKGVCVDCGLLKNGKIFDSDQLFYCLDCRKDTATTNTQNPNDDFIIEGDDETIQ